MESSDDRKLLIKIQTLNSCLLTKETESVEIDITFKIDCIAKYESGRFQL